MKEISYTAYALTSFSYVWLPLQHLATNNIVQAFLFLSYAYLVLINSTSLCFFLIMYVTNLAALSLSLFYLFCFIMDEMEHSFLFLMIAQLGNWKWMVLMVLLLHKILTLKNWTPHFSFHLNLSLHLTFKYSKQICNI